MAEASNGMLGVPVWEHDGIICTGETYKSCEADLRQGRVLEDPAGLFNSSLDGNVRRAIDIREGDKIDERAFKALVRAAMALNESRPARAVSVLKEAKARLRGVVKRSRSPSGGQRLGRALARPTQTTRFQVLGCCDWAKLRCKPAQCVEQRTAGSRSGGSPLLLPEHRRSSRSRSAASLNDGPLAD